jgi:prephenate dehydratase
MPVVAYQGEPGAFSDVAARTFIVDADTRGYESFDEVVDAVVSGAADYGVLPIENSIVGPIAASGELLRTTAAVRVCEELRLPIDMCVIGPPGSTLATITEIRSLPVALEQVQAFIARHGWRRVAAHDTAGAVREVIDLGDASIAAIGPALAAERYGGKILACGIQDQQNNSTRFVLIARSSN